MAIGAKEAPTAPFSFPAPHIIMAQSRHTLDLQLPQHGFTLVELVAVLVILGIVAAVAAPRLFNSTVFSERGYADEIAASLRYSRRIAMASACPVRFAVNAAGYSAAQPTVWCDPAGAWGMAVQFPDRRPLANTTPAGVVVGTTVVEFLDTGELVSPVAPLNVGAFSVTVDPATGAVTVQ
jgi:MSHA pilin protein MshC